MLTFLMGGCSSELNDSSELAGSHCLRREFDESLAMLKLGIFVAFAPIGD